MFELFQLDVYRAQKEHVAIAEVDKQIRPEVSATRKEGWMEFLHFR